MTADPVAIALLMAEALEGAGVRYLVGGSLASSLSGEPRSTLDVDLVVAITEPQADLLVRELGNEFHVDPDRLHRAIRDKTSTNLVHLETSIKVDLFVVGGSLRFNRRAAA